MLVGRHTFYAVRNIVVDGVRKTQYMHRFLMGVLDSTTDVDHKDHNGLNNRRNNIRIATHADNMRNRKKVGFKGVRFRKGKWYARITVNRKEISLGHFLHLQDAANSYDIAAKKYFGDFAYTNGEIS